MNDLIICQNQASKYAIIISTQHDQSCFAATILQNAIYQTTGVSLPIVTDTDREPGEYEIIVGYTNRENVTFSYERYELKELGFAIQTQGTNLIIDGGAFKGTIFAAYYFIRHFLNYDPMHLYQIPAKIDTLRVPADYYYENSPRSWADRIPSPTGKGAHMYMIPTHLLPNGATSFRGMGYVIQTANGKLMVIDGGHAVDAHGLIKTLQKLSGKEVPEVEGWFMTHIHADHIDAFLHIGETMPNALKVKAFYHHMPSEEYATRWGEADRHRRLNALRDTFCPFHEVQIGESMEVDGMKIDVVFTVSDRFEKYLTDRITDSIYSINSPNGDAINNSDTLYKFTADGHSALFIGDFMHFGEDYFYQYHADLLPTLKADMIQVCHHGSNFLSQRFYAHVNARVALWSNMLDCWYITDTFLRSIRIRLYELQLVKSHVAGDGIYPIPFDMSDITEEDTQYYRAELNVVKFSAGNLDGLLHSHQYTYHYDLDANTSVTAELIPFAPDASIEACLDGVSLPVVNNRCTFDAVHGKTLQVTVTASDGTANTYTFAIRPTPAKREVLRLDMAQPADNHLCDRSGNGNDALVENGTFVCEDGMNGFCPGANGVITVTDAADLAFGDKNFSISVWIKPDCIDKTGFLCYYGGDDLPRYSNRYYLQLNNNVKPPQYKNGVKLQPGCLRYLVCNKENRYNYALYSGQPLEPGKWYHVVVVTENWNQKIYINGVFSGERSFGIPMDINGKNQLYIGTGARGALPFHGAIGEFRMFNYALDENTIESIYRKES